MFPQINQTNVRLFKLNPNKDSGNNVMFLMPQIYNCRDAILASRWRNIMMTALPQLDAGASLAQRNS
jgi:hypothetical protein